MDVRRRFLEALASTVGFDSSLLDRSGTVVVGTEDRKDSGAIVHYEAGAHTLVWCDPILAGPLSELANDTHSIDVAAVAKWASAHGAEFVAAGDMRLLKTEPVTPPPVPAGYVHRWLDVDDVDLVRDFADRNSADDLDEAALDDLDNFDELAINVLTPVDASPDHIVAYASAAAWEWDETYCDIGVLVHPEHRHRGLGTWVVGHTMQALRAASLHPLYRHNQANAGSRRIADASGFELVTSLSYFAPPG